jgi:hypothetical protein
MRGILFILFLLLNLNFSGQELFFSAPTNFQSLPSSEVYQVFQDSKGIIWVCTDAGICRYNGNTLTTFTTKDGISENVILKAYEDQKGRIWFNTLAGYFFYYFNNQFHAIGANEYLKKKCGSFPINSFFIGENDTLYCAMITDMSLIKIAPQHNYSDVTRIPILRANRFIYTNKLKPEESVMGGGPGYISSENHAFSLLYKNKVLIIPFKNFNHFGNLWKGQSDRNGTLYLPQGAELFVIRGDGDSVKRYTLPYSISYIYTDMEGDLWIGTIKHGGFLFPHADLSLPPIHFLSNLSITSVMVDRENIVWATTLEKGVFQSMNKHLLYLNEKDDQAMYLQKTTDELNIAYHSRRVISLLKNDSIKINDGLKTQAPSGASSLMSCFISSRYDYFGFMNDIYAREKPSGALKFISPGALSQFIGIGDDSLLAIHAHAIFLLRKGNVSKYWKTAFPNRFIIQLKNKKILLAARNNNGLYEFKNDTPEPYLPQLNELKIRINCIVEDDSGNLWLATNEHGLYCYDHEKQLHHFDKINDKINTLAFDNKHQLWAGMNNGLSKISFTKDLNKIVVTHFNKQHGIPNEEINQVIEFNGKIACLTKDVFFLIDGAFLQKNSIPPLTYIDSVFINDQAYDSHQQAVLSHDKNSIHVFCSLIAYRNNNHKEYLYQLKRYDQNWHYSNSGDIQYTNLPPGSYTFMVYGLNNDKMKSDQPATYTFTIEKPFWFTWWFILLEISIIFIIIFYSVRYWKNKIEKREREKASINQEISEFKMTALRSQMNPHFIFNAIGSIQHYILKNEVKQSYNYLSKFSMLIRNILNNSRQEYISLTQEINTLRLYIELEQIRFTHPFQFKMEIDEALDMEMDIPTMLIQPYVENSIWHGLMPKESEGMLELIFKKAEDSMLVIIRDNGMGRKTEDPAKQHISKGMSITEQRINILTTTNKKKFITTIIDLKDAHGNSRGTEVNLIIPFDLQ